MKYKYRLILRGDNKYTYQYKEKGFLAFLVGWCDGWLIHEEEEKVIQAMNEQIKEDNQRHQKKYIKVIKVIEND